MCYICDELKRNGLDQETVALCFSYRETFAHMAYIVAAVLYFMNRSDLRAMRENAAYRIALMRNNEPGSLMVSPDVEAMLMAAIDTSREEWYSIANAVILPYMTLAVMYSKYLPPMEIVAAVVDKIKAIGDNNAVLH